jgi:hypothetical protein
MNTIDRIVKETPHVDEDGARLTSTTLHDLLWRCFALIPPTASAGAMLQ